MKPLSRVDEPSSLAGDARLVGRPLHVAHVHALKLYCVELGYRWGGMIPNSNDMNLLRNIIPEVDPLMQAKADYMLEKANKEDFLVVWDEIHARFWKEKVWRCSFAVRCLSFCLVIH